MLEYTTLAQIQGLQLRYAVRQYYI